MNIYKNRFLILLLSSSLLLSGCEMSSAQEYEESENFSADFGAVDSSTVFTGGESAYIQASEPVETNIISVEPQVTTALKSETENQNSESYLPPNMSMDDLLNMIQIDGKTLSMPTTLEDILALNDDFTCEMAFSEFYSTPEKCIEDMGGVFYDIKYNDSNLFQIIILKDDFTGDYMKSKIYIISSGFGKEFVDVGISLNLLNKINLNSSSTDILNILGYPNASTNLEPYNYGYSFFDNDYIINIKFCFVDEPQNDSYYELGSIQYNVERK